MKRVRRHPKQVEQERRRKIVSDEMRRVIVRLYEEHSKGAVAFSVELHPNATALYR